MWLVEVNTAVPAAEGATKPPAVLVTCKGEIVAADEGIVEYAYVDIIEGVSPPEHIPNPT